jgi:cytochrome oxidase Cu insertion factor (SCO1/SenC/PrrC family)
MEIDQRTRSRSRLFFMLLLLMSLTVAMGVWTWLRGMEAHRPVGQQLQIYGRVPNATLVERTGRNVGFRDLRGTIWVADFIFTRCGGTCQLMSAKMADLQKSLKKAGNVKLVSITVDPDFDTPDRLSAFADLYQADGEQWLFLTGSEAQIQKLATESFKLPLMEGTDPKEPIIHSTRFVLVDGDGNIRGYYNGLEIEATQRLVADVGTLLRDEEG